MLRHLSGCVVTFDLLLLHEPSTASLFSCILAAAGALGMQCFINLLLESKARVISRFCRSGSVQAAQNPSVHTEQLQHGSNLSGVTMRGENENEGRQSNAALYCHRLADPRHPPEATAPRSALFIQITCEFSREKQIPLNSKFRRATSRGLCLTLQTEARLLPRTIRINVVTYLIGKRLISPICIFNDTAALDLICHAEESMLI